RRLLISIRVRPAVRRLPSLPREVSLVQSTLPRLSRLRLVLRLIVRQVSRSSQAPLPGHVLLPLRLLEPIWSLSPARVVVTLTVQLSSLTSGTFPSLPVALSTSIPVPLVLLSLSLCPVCSVALGHTVTTGFDWRSCSLSAAVSLATNGTGSANLSCTSTTVNAFNADISGAGSPATASPSTTATFTFPGVVDYSTGVSSPA